MSDTEKLAAALREHLADEEVDISVMELSAHTDARIAEIIAHQRAVRRVHALLADLVVTDEWLATTERGIEVARARPSDLIT